MKTPEEIKIALRMCSNWEKNCEECPYKPMKRALSCSAEMKRDSLAYIDQLEKRTSLNTLRGGRDAQNNQGDEPRWNKAGLTLHRR